MCIRDSIIAGGNTCIVLASYNKPLCAVTFAEVLNSLFGITCDNIGEVSIDFSYSMEKCLSCGSVKFDSELVCAEKIAEVDLPVVTHESWNLLNDEEKRNAIKDLLDKIENRRN